ncbi:MAG TPA: general stress protein CsbD [Cytophagales bacterium]|nr:general stress protein CsbD [Cytophagales bacterium]
MNSEEKKNKKQLDLKLGANWNNLSGKIKKEFPNVTNSDLQFMSRGENELIGRLQIKSGKTKSQIRDWVRSTAKIM